MAQMENPFVRRGKKEQAGARKSTLSSLPFPVEKGEASFPVLLHHISASRVVLDYIP